MQSAEGVLSQSRSQQFGELELFALQSERVVGDVVEACHVKDRAFTGLVNQVLPLRHHRTPLNQFAGETGFIEQIQCGRMESGGAHVLRNCRFSLQYGHCDALVNEPPGQR